MYAGQLICLLGPNGAGKSTLLRTLAGLQPALNGVIELTGDPLHKLSTAQISKKLSLVLTDSVKSANLDVYSLVSLGRYPYSGWLGNLSTQDKETVEWALKATQVDHFRDRKITHLSDGECQKVMLARALAQDTPLIILDEPTAHLDLPSRIELMRLLHKLTKETNKGILLSTHELDLALQVADKIWLINKNGLLENESPEAMVLNGTFEAAFDKSGVVFDKSTGTFNIHQNQGRSVQIIGEGAAAFWTKRALIRQGYLIDASSTIIIEVRLVKNLTEWKITYNQNSVIKTTIDDATNHLTTLV
jgi:iron complex transport system ATP-binding protein